MKAANDDKSNKSRNLCYFKNLFDGEANQF